jgi:hypothetical protein
MKKTVVCGLLRREASGSWFFGERWIGTDREPIAGALEAAVADTLDVPPPELSDNRPPPVQTSFEWPVDEPQIAVDEKESLAHAHRQVWDALDEGTFCPCCQRTARRFPRHLHAEMAAFLVKLVQAYTAEKRWYHLREIIPCAVDSPKVSTDGSYLVCWGLVKRQHGTAGVYRPTPAGEAFVRGRTAVPKIAWVYSGRATHFSKELVTIREALEEQFSLLDMLRDKDGPGGDR